MVAESFSSPYRHPLTARSSFARATLAAEQAYYGLNLTFPRLRRHLHPPLGVSLAEKKCTGRNTSTSWFPCTTYP